MGFSRYLAQSEKTEIQLIWNNSMIKQNNKQLCEWQSVYTAQSVNYAHLML